MEEMHAVEAAMRALSRDKTVGITDIPDALEPDLILRGAADRCAFFNRYHSPELHQKLQPDNEEAREAFYAVEQARCEAIGALNMLGVAENISESIIKNLSNKPSKIERIYYSLWAELTNQENPPKYRIKKTIQKHVNLLKQSLLIQADYAEFSLRLLEDLGFDISKLEKNITPKIKIEETIESKAVEAEETENYTAIELSGFGGGESSEQNTGKPILEDREMSKDVISSSSSQINESPDYAEEFIAETGDDEYFIYTTEFDKSVLASKLSNPEELRELREELDIATAPIRSMIGPFAAKLQRHILARQKHAFQHSYESGLLDYKRLSRIVTNPANPECYQRKQEMDFRDTVVSLLIDNSGSMRGRPIMTAAVSTELLARSLERCGIRTEILGFTTQHWKGGEAYKKWKISGGYNNAGRMNDLLHIIYKSADMPWRKAKQSMGLMLRDGLLKENIDGEALLWAYDRLRVMPEARKIMIVISDGAPIDDATLSANNPDFLESHLHKVIHWLEAKNNIELLSIGIGHDVMRYYSKAVKITDVDDLAKTLVDKMMELL